MNATLDPVALRFRPLELEALPLLHRWMHSPHAERWWGRERSLGEVIAEYSAHITGRVPIYPFMVWYDAAPIGLVEWVRFGDFPELMKVYQLDDPDAVGCDVLIGEECFAHHGLGGPMVTRFLRDFPFRNPKHNACYIDPEKENLIAIRAYEKAGFRFVRDATDEDGSPIHLMGLTRAELEALR
jgi:RimJ/RimL family protein N-acetyltransferase